MENYVTYLIIGGIVVLVANGYRLRKKRSANLKLEAERIGLAFEEDEWTGLAFEEDDDCIPEEFFNQFSGFDLFTSKNINLDIISFSNRMLGERNGIDVMIFDWECTIEGPMIGGRSTSTHRESTVVFLKSDNMDLPTFKLEPKHPFHKILGMFGLKGIYSRIYGCEDIDIDTYPNFLKEYSLTGEDEKRIRNMFNSELLSALEQHKHICLEGYKNMLIYYSFKRSLLHLGRLCKPKNIECFLQKAESIHAVMAYSDKAQL